MPFVTTAMVRSHLKGFDDAEVSDVEDKIRQAQAMVLALIDREPDSEWNDDTDPDDDADFAMVQAAILKVVAHMYRFRGDDDVPVTDALDMVKPMLQAVGLRDPSLA
jgi:hypothetical protein